MEQHAAHWRIRSSNRVRWLIFDPVLDTTGSWSLGVVEAENEDNCARSRYRGPAVASRTAEIEVGKLLAGFVRTR